MAAAAPGEVGLVDRTPGLHLQPATTDETLRYLNPVVLPDGTMLVTAFSDATTYVGEQGPVYAVSLPAVLK